MPEDRWDDDDGLQAGRNWSLEDDRDRHWEEDLRTGRVHYMKGVSTGPRHSELGLVSLAISLLAGIMIAGSLVAGTVLVGLNPNLRPDNPQVLGLACGLLLGMGLSLLAGILGLVGLFQPDREKTFAALGVAVSGVEVLGITGLTLIGLVLG